VSTTITAATLTVTVTESVTLGQAAGDTSGMTAVDQGNTNNFTVASVTEVYKRIVTATTTIATLLTFSTTVGAGTFVASTVKYLRITNKDDTNYVELVVNGASNNSLCVKLEAGKSFVWGIGASSIDVNDSAAITSASFVNLSTITAKANTASVDLELFVAGT